jgi:hypothetical protein
MKALLSLLALALVTGCTTIRVARLHGMDPSASSLILASYEHGPSGAGRIWIGATWEQAVCRGEYLTASRGSGWGMIYGKGGPTFVQTFSAGAQPGRAVMRCDTGRVYECEYLTRGDEARGVGSCQDSDGHRYSLMF